MTGKTKTVKEDTTTAAQSSLQTKSAMMSGILAAMASMDNDQMMKWFPDAMELAGQTPNAAASNQASIRMKGGVVKEDVLALFEGDSLTEDAKEKFLTLIEHAVSVQTTIAKTILEEEAETLLEDRVVALQEAMEAKVDQYVTYAAEQWAETNELAIESTLVVEKAKRLFAGISALMAEADLTIDEGAESQVEALSKQVAALEAKLNEQIEENIAIKESLDLEVSKAVFKEVSEGLTALDVEKFKKLIEDMEVHEDADVLRNKLTIIKEAHFKKSAAKSTEAAAAGMTEATTAPEGEVITEEVKQVSEDPRINAMAEAISRGANRYSRGPYTR